MMKFYENTLTCKKRVCAAEVEIQLKRENMEKRIFYYLDRQMMQIVYLHHTVDNDALICL